MGFKINWDNMGILTSLACALHCAVLPLLVTSLPLFGIDIINNAAFEWGMIALAFFVGVYALYHGYKKHHNSLLPVYLFGAGMVFLVLKQIFHAYEIWFLIPAVALIIYAHYYNYILCRRTRCTSAHHAH